MKVSLNKANKIRNKLEGMSFAPVTSYSIRSDLVNPEEVHKSTVQAFMDEMDVLSKSILISKTLRTLISEANHKYGINSVIGEIAYTEKLIKSLSEFTSSSSHGYGRPSLESFEDFMSKIDFANKVREADPTKITPPFRSNVSLLVPDLVEGLGIQIKELKLQSSNLQEKRNELNHSNTVELPEDIVVFLKEHSII